MKINLISDTVTVPSAGMLQAMQNAQVGDDVFKEDPTVNALEEKVAKLFGMEAAMFFPSGTMANQTAIKVHTQPGEQLICDHFAHVYNYEGGGVSFNSGVSCRLITGNQGRITAQQIEEVINPTEFYHMPKTRLVCLENTTNKGGGAFYDFEEIRKIKTLCDKHQLGLHLDGARLWNALLETTEQPQDYGQTFDSISVCLSKGLGCPVGSVLLGSEAFIQQALRIRKVFGGGMRQAGYLAAAGIYAIDHQWEDMRQDHQKAKELAEILYSCDYVKKIEPVCTNIIIFSLLDSANELNFVEQMRQQDIHFMRLGKGKLRMVTHRDYTVEQHQVVLSTLKKMKL
ncbi:MAG: aminotransferase class I/II-fold pyridoxal phosphate-dependent enzyme [Flavobacteriaceae bacterium]|jgi:threonine aldolase|nr:aminotransferase class I/II-fold pyridoxal phosphate-dependent enzyme [Flavobacteriaceae bacterium]